MSTATFTVKGLDFEIDEKVWIQLVAEEVAKIIKKHLDKFVAKFQKSVLRGSGCGPGRTAWRKELGDAFTVDVPTIAGNVVSSKVHPRAGFLDDTATLVRSMLVVEGSGDKAKGGGEAIYRGPYGRMVWDNALSGQHPSQIHWREGTTKEQHLMP